MKKITITNAYTWQNKGDAGILLSTVDFLKRKYKDVEINILSFTPELDKKKYCIDKAIKNVESNILNPHPYKHTKIGKSIAIIKLLFKMIKIQCGIKLFRNRIIKNNHILSLLNESDIIVVCGGGFLGGKKLDSLMHIYQIYIDTLFSKPVYIMGTSIEPISNKIVKKYTESILKKVDYVFAREEITENYLKTVLPDNKHCLIPDMAFMLEDKKYSFNFVKELKRKNDYIFGITVRKWDFPELQSKEIAMNNYIDCVTKVMSKIMDEYNACFVFVPQVIVDHGNDAIVAHSIKDKLDDKVKNKFIIIEEDLSPYQIKSLIGEFDFFIGTRMHSNIFATSMKIPTTAIAYEKKTNGIMKTVELDEYIVEINNITEEELLSKVTKMIKNDQFIREKLNIKIEEIRRELNEKLSKII